MFTVFYISKDSLMERGCVCCKRARESNIVMYVPSPRLLGKLLSASYFRHKVHVTLTEADVNHFTLVPVIWC